jgi:hypothetical protein
MAANLGDRLHTAAEWTEIDGDARIRLPQEVITMISWYAAGDAIDVLLELREEGSVLVHSGARRQEVEQLRQALVTEFGGRVEGLRRAAISCAVFRTATIGKSNRRITLHTAVLEHLRVTKPARVLCLAYADRIEILSEAQAKEHIAITSADIRLEDSRDGPG